MRRACRPTLWCSSPPRTPASRAGCAARCRRSEEHTSELQSPCNLVCRLLLEKKNKAYNITYGASAKHAFLNPATAILLNQITANRILVRQAHHHHLEERKEQLTSDRPHTPSE